MLYVSHVFQRNGFSLCNPVIATTQKLPYLLHDFNMVNPDSWSVFSSGYNDNSNLVAPHPLIENLTVHINGHCSGSNLKTTLYEWWLQQLIFLNDFSVR